MLTDEQELVLSVVQSGHNAFFSGQGGTGKSFLIPTKCYPYLFPVGLHVQSMAPKAKQLLCIPIMDF